MSVLSKPYIDRMENPVIVAVLEMAESEIIDGSSRVGEGLAESNIELDHVDDMVQETSMKNWLFPLKNVRCATYI